MNDSQEIGLVGIGLLGTALAERLLARGFDVLGFDIRETQSAHLVELGGRASESSRQVMCECETTIWCLPTSDQSAALADELLETASGSGRIIDTTTGDPAQMQSIAHRLQSNQVEYLDATVAGSSQNVRRGEGVLMVGGPPAAFAACQPIFAAIAPKVFHLGPSGSGAKMKLVVNLVLGLQRAVLAEGLGFAEALKIDLNQALSVLKSGPAYCRSMDTKGENMIARSYKPQARLNQHKKDVGIILQTGQDSSAQLPLSTIHELLLQQAVELGYGEQDNCSIFEAFRQSQSD